MRPKEFNTILNAIPDSMALVERDGNIMSVNHSWHRFAQQNGADDATVRGVGMNYFEVCESAMALGAKEAEAVLQALRSVLSGDIDIAEIEYPCHAPDRQRWFLARVTPIEGEHGPVALVSHVNITDRKLAELKVAQESEVHREASLTDELTGLRNRRGFELFGSDLWAAAIRRGGAMAVVFVDLDLFKPINDTWGHEEGDRVLKVVAEHLLGTFRSSDIVARVGGDEFLVLAWMNDRDHLEHITARLKPELPLTAPDGSSYVLGMSYGVAAVGPVQGTLQELVEKADRLMYEQKQAGRKR
jgi:diguanylate cyclase (GGDEF)-like protein/PAS domain S-box-containing protein